MVNHVAVGEYSTVFVYEKACSKRVCGLHLVRGESHVLQLSVFYSAEIEGFPGREGDTVVMLVEDHHDSAGVLVINLFRALFP